MNPFSPDAIKRAVDEAIAVDLMPADRRRVLLLAPTVTNGDLDIKATFATKVGDVWQIGAALDWHHDGDLGAGITVAASW